jgi:hypothetical protein
VSLANSLANSLAKRRGDNNTRTGQRSTRPRSKFFAQVKYFIYCTYKIIMVIYNTANHPRDLQATALY